jgi:hypothetical protein
MTFNDFNEPDPLGRFKYESVVATRQDRGQYDLTEFGTGRPIGVVRRGPGEWDWTTTLRDGKTAIHSTLDDAARWAGRKPSLVSNVNREKKP